MDRREQFYFLRKNPEFRGLNLEIGGRVESIANRPASYQLVLRRGQQEVAINCLRAVANENLPENSSLLTEDEQFFALNSYTQGLAQVGFQVAFPQEQKRIITYDLCGFNSLQAQIVQAIHKLAPDATIPFLIRIFTGIVESIIDNVEIGILLEHAIKWLFKPLLSNGSDETRVFLTNIATSRQITLRIAAARLDVTPPDILDRLAVDLNEDVRSYVATNENTRPEILTLLAQDPDESVRSRDAHNPHTPLDALKLLAFDIDKDVRYEVARNPNTPVDFLAWRIKDGNWEVWSTAQRAILDRFHKKIDRMKLVDYCANCEWIFDPMSKFNPIRPMSFDQLPEDWDCPGCFAPKKSFIRGKNLKEFL